MSHLTISSFIESGKKSLEDKNYLSALSMALSLPSMCSRIQYKGEEYKSEYWRENNGSIYWSDKKCYIDFCNLIMRTNPIDPVNPMKDDSDESIRRKFGAPDGWLSYIFGNKFAEVLYKLRCNILHEGAANIITTDGKKIRLSLGETCTNYEFPEYNVISVEDLYEIIFDYIEKWVINSNYDINNNKYTSIFDIENSNSDRLQLKELCDNAMAK